MSKRKREIDFHVYLSEEENEVLNKFCKVMKTDRSKIIRAMILGTRLVEAPPVDYKQFIIELRRVGTNLNQLTAKANEQDLLTVLNAEKFYQISVHLNRISQNILNREKGDSFNGSYKNMADKK